MYFLWMHESFNYVLLVHCHTTFTFFVIENGLCQKIVTHPLYRSLHFQNSSCHMTAGNLDYLFHQPSLKILFFFHFIWNSPIQKLGFQTWAGNPGNFHCNSQRPQVSRYFLPIFETENLYFWENHSWKFGFFYH